jgi:hypothetical protein
LLGKVIKFSQKMANPKETVNTNPERAGDLIKRVEGMFGPLSEEQKTDFLRRAEEMEQEDFSLRDQRCGGCDVAGPPPWRRKRKKVNKS